MELELASVQRLLQIVFQPTAFLQLPVHLLVEEAIAAARRALGGIERPVGPFQKVVRIGPVLRRDCDADADSD